MKAPKHIIIQLKYDAVFPYMKRKEYMLHYKIYILTRDYWIGYSYSLVRHTNNKPIVYLGDPNWNPPSPARRS